MKEAPYIGLPRGVPGKKMSRVIVASYGSKQVFYVQICVGYFMFFMNCRLSLVADSNVLNASKHVMCPNNYRFRFMYV